MTVELLARLQFAFTIAFHYIFPPLSIGLGIMLIILEGMYLKTGDKIYEQLTKFWVKIFALTFALGVATGIVMEFEFGTNWANYSKFVGDVFGSALASEGIFAFFLESGFLAILVFGWEKVSPKVHFFSTIMVSLGSIFSAVWIVIANSWMQTPAGYHIVKHGMQNRAEITDFWAMVFNPSAASRLSHTIFGAFLAGAFFVISVNAFYLLKKKHVEHARAALKLALIYALTASLLQLITGHASAVVTAKYQPAKLAAMEGKFETKAPAELYIFGWVNKAEKTTYGIAIPGLLSFLIDGSFTSTKPVTGLDKIPEQDHPPVNFVFQTFHLMVMVGMAMIGISVLGILLWWRGKLFENGLILKIMVLSVFLPQIGNQAGWFTAEVGRQPWLVYGILRTADGLSKSVTSQHIIFSLFLFAFIYALLFALFIFLLNEKIKHGPVDTDSTPAYNQQKSLFHNNIEN
jgi:cytochrome d ubiquinol oxidase subunit I